MDDAKFTTRENNSALEQRDEVLEILETFLSASQWKPGWDLNAVQAVRKRAEAVVAKYLNQ